MSHPSAYSTFHPEALVSLLVSSFGIKNPEIVYLKRGFNDTYQVKSGTGKFILRVYRTGRRSLESIRSEIKLLLYLNENGQPVSIPLPGKEDVFVHPLPSPEGMRYAVLFSYALGTVCRKPDLRQCRDVGISLGTMHELFRSYDPGKLTWDYAPSSLFDYVRSSVEKALSAYPDDLRFLDLFRKQTEARLDGVKLKSGICHGDLQSENFYFQDSGEVCFIDFDFAGRGPLLYDLGAYTWYDHQGKTPSMLQAFYEGYDHVIPLSQDERDLIPLFGALRALFLMGMWNRFNDGATNPVWPAEQVSAFVSKVKDWVNKRVIF
jgi:Ser/Thr protein kinase RdoA (MazF antagonist)